MQCAEDPKPWEVRRMLWDFLDSPSMLAIFPLQDWVAMDPQLRRPDRMAERINEPANPHHHWRFRLHFDLHELMEASSPSPSRGWSRTPAVRPDAGRLSLMVPRRDPQKHFSLFLLSRVRNMDPRKRYITYFCIFDKI